MHSNGRISAYWTDSANTSFPAATCISRERQYSASTGPHTLQLKRRKLFRFAHVRLLNRAAQYIRDDFSELTHCRSCTFHDRSNHIAALRVQIHTEKSPLASGFQIGLRSPDTSRSLPSCALGNISTLTRPFVFCSTISQNFTHAFCQEFTVSMTWASYIDTVLSAVGLTASFFTPEPPHPAKNTAKSKLR